MYKVHNQSVEMNKPVNQNKMQTDSGVFATMVYQTLERMGIDIQYIFSQINHLDYPIGLPDLHTRYHSRIQNKFWHVTELLTGDPNIGLTVGKNLPPFRGQFFEYIFLSSPNFGQALNTAMQYYHYFTTCFNVEMHVQNGEVTLSGFEHEVRHYLECTISIVLSFFAFISQGQFKAKEICLSYDNTEFADIYMQIWNCPVRFNMPVGCIKFDESFLSQSSEASAPELFSMHQAFIEKQISLVNKHELVFEIEDVLRHQLPLREFSLEDIAGVLNLPSRRIQAALKDIGTSYEGVLNCFRQKLARQLLARTNLKQDEIVYQTGFSENSAFSRAFKNWTGESPSQYRKRKQMSYQSDPSICSI